MQLNPDKPAPIEFRPEEDVRIAQPFVDIGTRVGQLVQTKNAAYGNSFAQAGDFLRILYPYGVPPDQYDDMLTIVRVFDKLKRIATHKDALGENPWQDVCGYSILAIAKQENP